MSGHLVYVTLLVCFTAVSAALALIAVRVIGRITGMDSDELNYCTLMNAILTAFFVLCMLTASDFDTAPLKFLLSSLTVGFVLPLVYLVFWCLATAAVKFVRFIDALMGSNRKQ